MRLRTLALALVVVVAALLFLLRRAPTDIDARAADEAAVNERTAPAQIEAAAVAPSEPATESSVGAREAPTTLDERASEPAAALDPGVVLGVVYGRVLDPEGQPAGASAAYVSVIDARGERVGAPTNEHGDYSIAGVAPGEYELVFEGTGCRRQRAPLTLTADAPIVRRDLVLARAVVLPVRLLTPSGERLMDVLRARGSPYPRWAFPFAAATLEEPGATIARSRGHGQDTIGVGSLGASGRDSIGVLQLTVDLPVFVSLLMGPHVIATQRVEPGASEVVFVLDPEEALAASCTVHARFVAEDGGAPLTGMVDVEPLNMFLDVKDGEWNEALAPGRHTLTFYPPDYASIVREIELAPGQELDLGTIVVPRELTIEGRTVDADGQPVAVTLELARHNAKGTLVFDYLHVYGNEPSGEFTIPNLLPDDYALRTEQDDQLELPDADAPPTVWVSGVVHVSTRGGSVSGLEVRLVKAGFLVLRGTSASGATGCWVYDEGGVVLRSSGFYPDWNPRFALPPGPYTLVLFGEGRSELERRPIEIGAGVTEIDLTR